MHPTKTKDQFLSLRSQGWSLNRIADRIHVSKPTLVQWNREFGLILQCLRAMELEDLQEKFLAAHEADLDQLLARQKNVESELAKRKLGDVPTEKLFRVSALLRQQIQKSRADARIMKDRSQFVPLPHLPPLATAFEEFKQHAHAAASPAKSAPDAPVSPTPADPPIR